MNFILRATCVCVCFFFLCMLWETFLSLAPQPKLGLGRLILRFQYHRQLRNTPGSTPRKQWPARRRGRFITHNKHNGRIFMLSVGFEPAIPTVKQLVADPRLRPHGHLQQPPRDLFRRISSQKRECAAFPLFPNPWRTFKTHCNCCSNISLTRFKMKKLNFGTQGV